MAASCQLNCVETALGRGFGKYGKFLAQHPWPFLIIPVLISLILTSGVSKLQREDNIEMMYTPTNGEAKDERRLVQEYFPENHTHSFMPSRKTDLSGYVQIVITGSLGFKNIFTPDAMAEIMDLDNEIKTYAINFESYNLAYVDICGKWNGKCSENALLEILEYNPENVITANITYPIHDYRYFLGMQIGGVELNDDQFINYAEAVALTYFVAYQTDEEIAVANAWMHEMTKFISHLGNTKYISVELNFASALSMDDELARATGNIVPLFSIAYTILMTFASVSSSMKDWVRCKTWVTLAGEASAVLAVGASMGFLSYCGVLYTSTVGIMPFLIVGIGIDNMFVLLSAWRHTNYLLPVEERMSLTFEKAAVSITLTSLTNAIAFAVGMYTSFLSIQLFCAYTGLAVVFCYINTVTFLAACMVLSGRREAKNHHAIVTCKKATPKEYVEEKKKAYKIFCTGGDADMDHPIRVKDLLNKGEIRKDIPLFSKMLCDKYAPFIMKTPVRAAVITMYVIYLAFSTWGCVSLQEGLELKNLAPDDSYLVPYYGNFSDYFLSEYGPRVMVAINEPLDYHKSDVSENVHKTVQSFLDSEFFFSEVYLSESWLRDFEAFLTVKGIDRPDNLTSFIDVLRSQFLVLPPFEKYKLDINFTEDYSQIIGSRFMVQSYGIEDAMQEKELLLEVRKISEASVYETTSYHSAFIFYDQYIVIVGNTVRNLLMAAFCMLIVAIVLLPDPLAVIWVTISVLSIITGVVGFMVFWDVSLDSISMINLVMCIGFSIDFSGHICYHYYTCKEPTPMAKLKETMKFLGLPIWQGAVSTILGVIVLSFSDAYIFRTFFKIIFLVVVFGFFHAMVVLPVILTTVGPGSFTKAKTNSDNLQELEPHNSNIFIMNSQVVKPRLILDGKDNASFNFKE